MSKEIIKLELVRTKLASGRGRQQWKSLDELADTPDFQDMVAREFPQQAAEWGDPVSRRSFLKLMGASLALSGLTGCQYALQQPTEKIIPYVRVPEQEIPGRPLFYATARTHAGYGVGILAEQHEGRPTKLEGNPDHPGSLGRSDVFLQANALTMYDPERSQQVLNKGNKSTWNDFTAAITGVLNGLRGNGGAGLRILTETVTSPTLASQITALLQTFPSARWVQYDPISFDNVRAGSQLAFGDNVHTTYRFDQADVVVSLDADVLFTFPGHIRYSYDLINKRRVREANKTMSRVYVAEATPTITGSIADHRLPVKPSQIGPMARALAQALGVQGVADSGELPETARKWVEVAAKDLQAKPGASVVVAGEQQPPAVHALCHAINAALQNIGKTVNYTDPVEAQPATQLADLQTLVGEMNGGTVQALVMLDVNPVFTAPADLNFTDALSKVPNSVHVGLYVDETAQKSAWHVNGAHFLETWSDARAFDGTASIIQPLIAPLYGGKSAHEIIDVFAGQSRSSYDIVRAYWQGQTTGGDFQNTWNVILRDGVIPNTAAAAKQATLRTGFDTATPASAGELELVIRPDNSIWDGSYANNAWLMELPRPFSKLTWDNAAIISPATAQRLGLGTEDTVNLKLGNTTVSAPVWVQPGQANDTVTVHLGYGRTAAGQVGNGVGFNAYPLRTTQNLWFAGGVQLAKAGGTYRLASTQNHFSLQESALASEQAEKREIIRNATLDEFIKNSEVFHEEEHGAISLHPRYPYSGYAWGMVIDHNACIACNACIVACQAENNIPTVGKDQVGRGREMQWIRIDQYYEGGLDNPGVFSQPMLCQQCEQAPCEIVCPVAATVHDAEGLNNMVYNRCVGTKYCSNNCPYKVRRFNFLQYSDDTTPSLKMQRNPNVTVRIKGVMEKCTYCTQRISAARQDAEREQRQILDGELVTACQQSCPTNAITFGNINDANSAVSKLKQEPTNYSVLTELNTFPRTTYLARILNPNPELGGEATHAEEPDARITST